MFRNPHSNLCGVLNVEKLTDMEGEGGFVYWLQRGGLFLIKDVNWVEILIRSCQRE